MLRLPNALVSLVTVAALTLPAGAALASPEPGEPPRRPLPVKGDTQPLAEIKVSRADAIALARSAFEIPAALGEPNADVSQWRDGAVWNLYWSSPEKQEQEIGISVGVDAISGEITSYSRWSPAVDLPSLSFTRTEAQAVAARWLRKLVPRADGSLRLAEHVPMIGMRAQASYHFRWDRLEQGYRVLGDGVTIEIDARSGALLSYSRNWQKERTFALPREVLTAAQAETAYRKLLPMHTFYRQFQKPGADQPRWHLVYQPAAGFYPQLSQGGQLIHPTGEPIDLDRYAQPQVVPENTTPYQAPSSPLAQEAALKLAQVASGRQDAPTSVAYRESGKESISRYYDFGWHLDSKLTEGQVNTNVTVDATRGVVTHMDHWGMEAPWKEGEVPAVSEPEARKAAIAFLQARRPDLAGKIALVETGDSLFMREKVAWQGRYIFSFAHLVHGIPVLLNQGTIQVDMRTGEVRSLWSYDLPEGLTGFPRGIRVVDPMDAFFAHQGLEPVWSEAGLVWMATPDINLSAIDAHSGAPLDFQGQDLRDVSRPPVDMDGHWAQREVELLWYRGLFELKEARFEPGQALTVAEAARWLVLARGYQPFMGYDFAKAFPAAPEAAEKLAGSDAARYFGAAFEHRIIRPEDFGGQVDPTATVTRELFALWAVRAMGYGRIAELSVRLEMNFADRAQVGARYANAVAVLQGFGIIRGDGQSFAPQRSVTRAEAAKILFAASAETGR